MSDAEDMTIEDTDVAPIEEDTSGWEHAWATTAEEKDIPDNAPEGLHRFTEEEMGYLKVLSWGDSVHRETCEACSAEMVFERHPADWDWHPSGVRVRIECPKCGHMQYTDGATEVEYVEQLNAALMAKAREDYLAQAMEANGGKPISLQDIRSGDLASSAEQSRGSAPAS